MVLISFTNYICTRERYIFLSSFCSFLNSCLNTFGCPFFNIFKSKVLDIGFSYWLCCSCIIKNSIAFYFKDIMIFNYKILIWNFNWLTSLISNIIILNILIHTIIQDIFILVYLKIILEHIKYIWEVHFLILVQVE